MTPSRRRRPSAYRPPRDRREILVAVLCALGVLAVTVALLFVLRPRDDDGGSDVPPVSVPLPTDSVPTEPIPTESIPTDTAPAPPAS